MQAARELGRQACRLHHTILLSSSTAQALDSAIPLQPLETTMSPLDVQEEMALFTVPENGTPPTETIHLNG